MKLKFLFHRINQNVSTIGFPRNILNIYMHRNRENHYLWAELYITTRTLAQSLKDLFILYTYKKL